jgi:UDP-N-acetylglucosamine diphosphorylase/glucosamine-1-phosphate N-acetyltransferase
LDKIPDGGIAVKGGYVVAAKLPTEAARDFAAYIRARISEETIERLCEELRGYVSGGNKPATGKAKAKKKAPAAEAAEGSFEDDHVTGQDDVVEKLPQRLLQFIDKHNLARLDVSEARLLSFPWQIVEENPVAIEDDFQKSPFRGQSEESIVYPGVRMVGEENIFIGESSVIRPGVVLDASSGPIIISDGTTVMPNTTILGPVSIGKGSIIKSGAKILEGTSVGDTCKIGGEVDQTIFGAYTNKQHDGFIGHSYIGEWVNIGAGTNNSDLKNNYSAVRMWSAGVVRETGRQFLGLIMGDHSKTGIGTLFNSGTVVGFNCNIYGSAIVDRFVPSFSWGQGGDMTEYKLEKALLTAQVVMERRDVKFDRVCRAVFQKIFELTEKCQRNV